MDANRSILRAIGEQHMSKAMRSVHVAVLFCYFLDGGRWWGEINRSMDLIGHEGTSQPASNRMNRLLLWGVKLHILVLPYSSSMLIVVLLLTPWSCAIHDSVCCSCSPFQTVNRDVSCL
jgi:hypothetical protein